jgi:hypothetical protein
VNRGGAATSADAASPEFDVTFAELRKIFRTVEIKHSSANFARSPGIGHYDHWFAGALQYVLNRVEKVGGASSAVQAYEINIRVGIESFGCLRFG